MLAFVIISSCFQISSFQSMNDSVTADAIFLTQDSVLCEVNGSPPFTGLMLSVSNDGQSQSTSLYYVIQDPVCYNCILEDKTCYLQVKIITTNQLKLTLKPNIWQVFFVFVFFSVRFLSVLHSHSVFSSPPQRPMTSRRRYLTSLRLYSKIICMLTILKE